MLTQKPDCNDLNEASALQAAEEFIFLRPLQPYPGWSFSTDWDNPDPAFQQRRRIWEYFNHKRLQAPLCFPWYGGLRFNLYLGTDLSRQLFIAGCVEPNVFAVLDRLLQPGMVFVDAGANEGLFTLFASQRIGDAGRVWAFEPSEREFLRLQANLRLNGRQNVRAFRMGLAERDGEEALAIADFGHEGVNTLGAFAHEGISLLRTERVPVRKLDDLIRDANVERIDVLKVDVEGAESRVIEGARDVLAEHRPVVLFEAFDPCLRLQGSSAASLTRRLSSFGYALLVYDAESGLPSLAKEGQITDNMIAMPEGHPFVNTLVHIRDRSPAPASARLQTIQKEPTLQAFNPAQAYWNQRTTLAKAHDRILSLSNLVDRRSDLWPYQWTQLMSAALEYQPDLILELGRGAGNSTCAFTEASNLSGGRFRILSLCLSSEWEHDTTPRLKNMVSEEWFRPLQAVRGDILEFNYEEALRGSRRVLIFWDAHGFDIAECVLGGILPVAALREHLVIMHDLSDARYNSEEQLEYGPNGLWKGNNWSGPRIKLGIVDSAVEQAVSAVDFTTRNHLTLDSADHSFRTQLSSAQKGEMSATLGELFDTQGHWFHFTLNERSAPYKFPQFARRKAGNHSDGRRR
jgi:FkbM family methyltransferase